jgi:hypothetical protein
MLDKRRRKQDRPHRERSVLEGPAGHLHERMPMLWIREDTHTVGDLRGIDGIGRFRSGRISAITGLVIRANDLTEPAPLDGVA